MNSMGEAHDKNSISNPGPDFLIACSLSGVLLMTLTLSLTPSHAATTARAVAPAPIIKTFPLASLPLKAKA